MGPVYTCLLLAGLAVYLVSKRTPSYAYQSMIRLFCITRGRSNDWLSRTIGLFKRPYAFPKRRGILGDMADPVLRGEVITALRERGFYIFKQRLRDDICDRLLKYATTQPCEMRPMDSQTAAGSLASSYHRGTPQAVRYEFEPAELLKNTDIQRLLADLSFADVAQDYLGSRPIADVLSMWWLTDYSNQPDSRAAQYFHFDMDRPKWLKFFIYLTNVESVNGPHSFVRGSQKTGAIPYNILKKGYARLTDGEVAAAFGPDAITTMVAPRGTVIVEDTRGLHKGNQVMAGDRLILQIQYSNSLFGGSYPKASFSGPMIQELKELTQTFPEIYSAYL